MSDILKGKVVVMTGASSGIGRAIAVKEAGGVYSGVDVMVADAGITLKAGGAAVAAT